MTGIVLVNGPGLFDPSDEDLFDIVPLTAYPLPGAVGIPAIAQVDAEVFDGLNPADLVFPVGGTGRVEVFTRLPVQRVRLPLEQMPPTSADVYHAWTEYNPNAWGGTEGRLVVKFRRLPRYSDCDEVRLAVWREDAPAAYLPPTSIPPTTVNYVSYPLLDGPGSDYQWIECQYHFPLGPFPQGNCWGTTSEVAPCFYVELRFYDGPTASRVFPAGFRLQKCVVGSESSNYPYIEQQGILNKDFNLLSDWPGGPGELGSAQLLGIFVPMSSNPPFQGGESPSRVGLVPSPEGRYGIFQFPP